MAGEAVVIVLVILIIPVVLYVLLQAEHEQREEMSREDAEYTVRQDTHER